MTCFDASQRSEFILKMHETAKLNIEKMNEMYRIAASKGRKGVKLEPGDLVWLHLRKKRFSEVRKSKLMSCVAGPFKILAKINDNAYKLELPPEFGVSPSFNILDLRPYLGEEDEIPSRTASMQEGEDDEDINTFRYTILSPPCEACVSLKGKLFHTTKENTKLHHKVAYLTVHLEKTILSMKMIEEDLSRVEESATKTTYRLCVGLRDVRKRVRRVILSLFLALATIKKRKHSNQPKLITHSVQSHP
jgi:hypothetical protein